MGRSLVEGALNNDFTISFGYGGWAGLCDASERKVFLNPTSVSTDEMVMTLVHECTHAFQGIVHENEKMAEGAFTSLPDYLMYHHAIEADAKTHEILFAYEMKEKRPQYWDIEKGKNPTLLYRFDDEIAKTNDVKAAARNAFFGWYEDACVRKFYDKWYGDFALSWLKENDTDLFATSLDPAAVLKGILFEGKPYFSEADLKTGHPYSVDAVYQRRYNRYAKDYTARTGIDIPDTSGMISRNRYGELPEEAVARKAMDKTFVPFENVKGTLQKAFSSPQKNEKKKLEEVFALLEQSEMGRSLLTTVKKQNYSIVLETASKRIVSLSNDAKRMIINPKYSVEDIISCFGFYAAKIGSFNHSFFRDVSLENQSAALIFKSMASAKADAFAKHALLAYELRDASPSFFKKAKKETPEIMTAITAEMEKSGDKKAALLAGFEAWYITNDNKRYEKSFADDVEYFANYGKDYGDTNLLQYNVSDKKITSAYLYNDTPYVPVETLKDPRINSISTDTFNRTWTAVNKYVKDVPGAKLDKSVLAFNQRDKAGNITLTQGAANISAAFKAKAASR